MRRTRLVLCVALIVSAGVVLGGCTSAEMGSMGKDMATSAAPQAAMEMAYDAEGDMTGAVTGGDAMSALDFISSAAEAAGTNRQIIYTADMDLWVDDVDAAAQRVETEIEGMGGWLQGKDAHVDYQNQPNCTLRLRVPAAMFNDAMAALRAMGDVRRETMDSQDVTAQLVDLDARLKNLRREEEVVAELFDRKGKISDVLEVERELARVRGQIEQIEASLRTLGEQVAFSSITVSLAPQPSPVVRKVSKWNLGRHVLAAWNLLVSIVRGIIISLIYIVMIGTPIVVLIHILRWAWRRRKANRPPPPPPAVQQVAEQPTPTEPPAGE